MQLNRLRELLGCPLMDAIGYVVKTLRQNIENSQVKGTNPHGRIVGLRRIPNSNYETERNRVRRDGYYVFPCGVLNSMCHFKARRIERKNSIFPRNLRNVY